MAINPLLMGQNQKIGIGNQPPVNQPAQPSGSSPMFASDIKLGSTGMGTRAASPAANIQSPTNQIQTKFTAPQTQQSPQSAITTSQPLPPPVSAPSTQVPQGASYQLGGQYYDPMGNVIGSALRIPEGAQKVQAPYIPNQGLYGQLVTGLANVPQESPDVAQARQNLQQLQNQFAQTQAQIGGTPGLGQQETMGQQGLLQQLFATKQQAAQTALANALQSQELQQQALGQAAGLAAPQQYGITGVPFQPTTGQFGGVAGAGATGGGVFGAGGVTGQLDLGQQSAQLQAVQRQTQNLGTQLSGFLDQNPDINSLFGSGALTFTPATGLVQLAAQYMGDPRYQTFSNLVNDLISRYSAILTPAGANPTDARLAIAQSLINPRATPQSIKQVISNLDQQAQAVVQGLNPSLPGGTAPAIGNTFGSFFGQ